MLFKSGSKKGVPAKLADEILRRLDALDSAPARLVHTRVRSARVARRPRGYVEHQLNWQLADNVSVQRYDAFDVSLEDYH